MIFLLFRGATLYLAALFCDATIIPRFAGKRAIIIMNAVHLHSVQPLISWRRLLV
jgi:hypothetical protein